MNLTLEQRIAANRPVDPSEVTRIMLLLLSAFDELVCGTAEVAHFNRLGEAINVGMVRSEQIGGHHAIRVFVDAGTVLMEARERRAEPHHLEKVKDCISLYEELLKASTPMQMYIAAEEARKRMERGQVRTA